MESSDATSFHCLSSPSASPTPSPTSSPPPPLPLPPPTPQAQAAPPAVHSPCAACKILRRRCADKCVLAPYFPPAEPLKFTTAHRVFGASNIIKLLQELPESQRADAVSSMVYEANARIRDPVYGCAGAICQLQKQANELQAQLARTQAELINLQAQNNNLIALICMEVAQIKQHQHYFCGGGSSPQPSSAAHHHALANYQNDGAAFFLDDIDTGAAQGYLLDQEMVPLWT